MRTGTARKQKDCQRQPSWNERSVAEKITCAFPAGPEACSGDFPWRTLIVAGIASYAVFTSLLLVTGQVNGDEGWYLYASKLALRGKKVYQDFSYTQMPLMPYLYGLPQRFIEGGMYVGRITSVLLSLAACLLGVLTARKLASRIGASLAVALFGSFTYGIYYTSIVKTYALVWFFFAVSLFLMSTETRETLRLSLAGLSAIAACMVRLSAIAFAVVVVGYCFCAAKRTATRVYLFAIILLSIAIAGWFIVPDLHAARYNLLGHHLSQWSQTGILDKILDVVTDRIPQMARLFGPQILLLCACGLVVLRSGASVLRTLYGPRMLAISAVGAGALLFGLSHLVTGHWHKEYLVPSCMALLPIVAVVFARTYQLRAVTAKQRRVLRLAMIAALVWPLLAHRLKHMDLSGGQLPLQEIRQVARFVSDRSDPSDRLLTLSSLFVAVDADRDVLPGLEMGAFSYCSLTREQADRLRLVNSETLLEYLQEGVAKVVVLTDLDWRKFRNTEVAKDLRSALDRRYDLALKKRHFGPRGPKGENVYVYIRKTVTQESPNASGKRS